MGGRRAVMEAIRSGAALSVVAVQGSRRKPGMRDILEAARRAGLGVEWVEDGAALERNRIPDAQGVVAVVAPPRELGERDLATFPFPEDALVVVLDGIEDPQNLGACARSAEAAGAALLVSRERRAAPTSPAAVRASAGALLHLPLARVPNLRRALERLQDRGFTVAGLDGDAEATIHDEPPSGPLALVVGAEGEGISRLVRETCDLLVRIPLAGRTASLNAAAALAVGLFGWAARPLGRAPDGS